MYIYIYIYIYIHLYVYMFVCTFIFLIIVTKWIIFHQCHFVSTKWKNFNDLSCTHIVKAMEKGNLRIKNLKTCLFLRYGKE